ncbi:MAG: hypothetical protein GQ574_22330 [Crocinitomix sp.]|nr:hypothetical protein [Crocinitomix sp.]
MRWLILLFVSFQLATSYGQNTDSTACSQIKTGEFYVINKGDTCFISRTADRQTEKCNGSDSEYELIVIWLSEKKYILRDVHYNPSTNPRVMRKDVVMTIMNKTLDWHVVNVKIKGQKNRLMTVYCNK